MRATGSLACALDWPRAYKALGIRPDMPLPASRPGRFDIYVLKGVTPSRVINALRRHGVDVRAYLDDADKIASANDRDAISGSYRISFLANVEADPQFAHRSASDIWSERSIRAITLPERLLLGFAYFLGTGEHLDCESVTLCAGSRDFKGRVPGVSFISDCHTLAIDYSCPEDYHEALRARAAVP